MTLIDWICLGVCILHILFSLVISPILSKRQIIKYCDDCKTYHFGNSSCELVKKLTKKQLGLIESFIDSLSIDKKASLSSDTIDYLTSFVLGILSDTAKEN